MADINRLEVVAGARVNVRSSSFLHSNGIVDETFAIIDVTSTGDNLILSGVPGYSIRVMSFWFTTGAAALVAVASNPVQAHVTPTRAITDAELLIYNYPDRTTNIVQDGTGIIDFSAIRIELILTFLKRDADGNSLANVPTEHWTSRITVSGVDPQGNDTRMVKLWDMLWHHQNSKGRFNPTEVFQGNTYRPLNGPGNINVQITGDESGFFKEIDVPFTVVIP